MAVPTHRYARRALLFMAFLLAAPGCAAPVRAAGAKPLPTATAPGRHIDDDHCVAPPPGVPDPVITVLVRLEELSPKEAERLSNRGDHLDDPGAGDVVAPPSIVMTNRKSRLECILRHPIQIGR